MRSASAVCCIGLFFLGVAVGDHVETYRLRDLLVLAVLYLALASVAVALALLPTRWGRLWSLLGGVGLALVALWHVREQTDLVHFKAGAVFAACLLVVLSATAMALLWLAAKHWRPRHAGVLVTCGLIGSLLVTAVYLADPRFRWAVLRHHRMVSAVLDATVLDPVPDLTRVFSEPVIWASSPEPPVPSTPSEASETPRSRPHVVVILVDTLRADALETYGGSPELMPRVDGWARRGDVLRDVWANASWTSPSVASLFTGLAPEQHGLWDNRTRLSDANVTLAEVFRDRGYRTLAVVTNGNVGGELGFDQGFDRFLEPQGDGGYARADQVRRVVSRQLRKLAANPEALFLYIHLMEPHTPYLSDRTPAFWEPAHHRASYDAELRFLDEQLDGLLRDLDDLLPTPRVTLVTSDHGEEFGEHGDRGHGHSLYQELIHVPAIVHTGEDTGREIDTPLELRDLFDFLVSYEPGSSTEDWARRNHRAVRCASSYATPTSLASLYMLRPYTRHRLRAATREDHVWIWSGFGPYVEAYDLGKDPRQLDNLGAGSRQDVEAVLGECTTWATAPAFGEKSEELTEKLKALGYAQ